MNDAAITVDGLSKAYRIGLKGHRHETLLGAAATTLASPWRSLRNLRRLTRFGGADDEDMVWALRDVSADIQSGETVGVIGRNGAGKSTFLKILSRITEPTRGQARIRGRVASLLEVGTGFHPDLTGRENVYLNGTILGMRKREIDARFERIAEFSGVERFLDTPVKRYSSGMRVRLGFAVAAHLQPDILIIDEVLAVGDAEFQRRCLGKMTEVASEGRTVLFVSHNLSAVTQLCRRGIWIEGGVVKRDGPVQEVVEAYLESLSDRPVDFHAEDYALTITRVTLRDPRGQEAKRFEPGDDVVIEIGYDAKRRIEKPAFLLKIQSAKGPCFAANMLLDGFRPAFIEGVGALTCRFKAVSLMPQMYTVLVGVRSAANDKIMSTREVTSFSVCCDLRRYGFTGNLAGASATSVPFVVPYEWSLPDGQVGRFSLSRVAHEVA